MADAAVERLQQDRAVRHPRRRGSDLSLRRGPRDGHAARPHHRGDPGPACAPGIDAMLRPGRVRSEEHTSELQSLTNSASRPLLYEKKTVSDLMKNETDTNR